MRKNRIREKDDKEISAHMFRVGFLYAHALFRHMIKQLEQDEHKCVEVLCRYIEKIHQVHMEDEVYQRGYIVMESEADLQVSENYEYFEDEGELDEDCCDDCDY